VHIVAGPTVPILLNGSGPAGLQALLMRAADPAARGPVPAVTHRVGVRIVVFGISCLAEAYAPPLPHPTARQVASERWRDAINCAS
jgi:hypothetical protein